MRLNLAAETVNCKSGKRSRGAARLLVVDRADDVTKLLAKAKALLKTKRAPRVAYVADTGLELRDTRGVEDGTLLCVSDDAPAPEPPKAPEQALELGSPAAWDGLALTATTPREEAVAPSPEEAVAPSREEAVAPSPSPAENRGAAPVRIDAGRKAAMDAIREPGARACPRRRPREPRSSIAARRIGSTQIPQFLLEDAAARVVVRSRGASPPCRWRSASTANGARRRWKSTQIRQFLLEDAAARVVVDATPARWRGDAVSLAERVAEK